MRNSDESLLLNILVKKITLTRKKKSSNARDDVISKKVFRAIKEYFDVKLD
tara:strand:+ start:66 stop:218 length:153 start_codon:yes stop_codon:yes gene_type:complete